MKIYLDIVGCRLNQAEIEQFAHQFRSTGHVLVSTPEKADLAVINTCTVTAAAASDSRGKIRQAKRAGVGELVLCHQKALYRGWRVVLSGCCPHVSEVLGVTHLAGRIDQVPSEEQALQRLRILTGRWSSRAQPQAAGHLV